VQSASVCSTSISRRSSRSAAAAGAGGAAANISGPVVHQVSADVGRYDSSEPVSTAAADGSTYAMPRKVLPDTAVPAAASVDTVLLDIDADDVDAWLNKTHDQP
jgi:hypothetical protein